MYRKMDVFSKMSNVEKAWFKKEKHYKFDFCLIFNEQPYGINWLEPSENSASKCLSSFLNS